MAGIVRSNSAVSWGLAPTGTGLRIAIALSVWEISEKAGLWLKARGLWSILQALRSPRLLSQAQALIGRGADAATRIAAVRSGEGHERVLSALIEMRGKPRPFGAGKDSADTAGVAYAG